MRVKASRRGLIVKKPHKLVTNLNQSDLSTLQSPVLPLYQLLLPPLRQFIWQPVCVSNQ